MDIKGTIKLVHPAQVVSEKFTKRDFVVITDEQYPQHIIMQMTQDRCDFLDGVKAGDEVKCHINIRGREWYAPDGKLAHFNTIECWKIQKMAWSNPATTATEAPAQNTQNAPTAEPTKKGAEPVVDDLPF